MPNLIMKPLEERERSVLAEPFPRSWMLMVAGGVALALIVAFLVQALAVRGDWAESALVAGYTAFGLAVFALVVTGIRYALGRRATVFYALAGLLLVVLLGTGGGALAMAHQLHLVQAQSFEASGQWNQAATEYALYGERAPHAPNLGRVYLALGTGSGEEAGVVGRRHSSLRRARRQPQRRRPGRAGEHCALYNFRRMDEGRCRACPLSRRD